MRTYERSALRAGLVGCVTLGVSLATCTDVTDVQRLEIAAEGGVVGQAYLDLNGNGTSDGADQPLADVTIVLSDAAGGASVAEVQTDAEGVFAFEAVAVGTYTLALHADLLADSLVTVEAPEPFDVGPDGTAEAILGASFPALTLAEVRAAEPGRRVFTTGIALNARLSAGDGRVFLQEGDSYLQTTGVLRDPAVGIGDSIRFLGRTRLRAGQPTLDEVSPLILVRQAQIPVILESTTGDAADAADGTLDAALVRIRAADISDTATVDGDFHFRADDGSGPVDVVLRRFLGFNEPPDQNGRVTRAVGLLAPHDDGSGTVRWRLLVRSAAEFVTEVRQADLAVTAELDPDTASQGESVQIRLIVSNLGPLSAENVVVADTLDANLTRNSSVVTRGTYASAGTAGTWSVGNLAAGAADTLTITADVTGTDTGEVPFIGRITSFDRAVDPAPGNNRVVANLVLEAPGS